MFLAPQFYSSIAPMGWDDGNFGNNLGNSLMFISALGGKPITSSVILEDQLVHVGYAEEREDLFIMGLPASKVKLFLLCPNAKN